MGIRQIGSDPAGGGTRTSARVKAGAAGGAILLTGALLGWTTGTAAQNGATTPNAERRTQNAEDRGPAAHEQAAGNISGSYAGIVDKVAPAVVTVRSERQVTQISQLPDHPLLRDFFGDRFGSPRRPQPDRRQRGLGSGVIVRTDGYILTNHHVIDGADEVTVDLTDGRSFKATVVGSDAPSDLAVLKIDAPNLQTLALADSDAVRVGDVVLAVGNPLGVGQTVTMGIVSAKGRATGGSGNGSYEDFIQTDAPINQGNSGGALVSTRGELIGINSQILSPSGGNIGIGFSIPADMARNVMTQLIDHGEVRRGMLGVTIQPVTSDLARSLQLDQVAGALVSSVQPDSPAAKAGIERGDVITALDGEAVRDGNVLRNQIAQMLPDSTVKLTLLRTGKEQTVSVMLSELQTASARAEGSGDADSSGYGMRVEPLTAEHADQLGVTARKGVVVSAVDPSGRAAAAGIRVGDVIEEVDGRPVQTVDALRSALDAGDRPALVLVHRDGTTMFLTLERPS